MDDKRWIMDWTTGDEECSGGLEPGGAWSSAAVAPEGAKELARRGRFWSSANAPDIYSNGEIIHTAPYHGLLHKYSISDKFCTGNVYKIYLRASIATTTSGGSCVLSRRRQHQYMYVHMEGNIETGSNINITILDLSVQHQHLVLFFYSPTRLDKTSTLQHSTSFLQGHIKRPDGNLDLARGGGQAVSCAQPAPKHHSSAGTSQTTPRIYAQGLVRGGEEGTVQC